jgi:hypothetical protein
MNGTPPELKIVAENVLAWVANERKAPLGVSDDDIRRIELCAKAVMEYCMLLELNGLTGEH